MDRSTPDRPLDFSDSVLVVAHPDDEALWFSSICRRVNHILICFTDIPGTDMGAARRRAIADYPIPWIATLDVAEPLAMQTTDWRLARETSYGLQVTPWFGVRRRYEHAFRQVRSLLADRLAGFKTVFTHNPWGEYGHEEHVLVFRAVADLRTSLDFEMLCPNYASQRNAHMVGRYLSRYGSQYYSLPTDPEFGRSALELYEQAGCLTWPAHYRWFETECFARIDDLSPSTAPWGHLFPLNYEQVDFPDHIPFHTRLTREIERVYWEWRENSKTAMRLKQWYYRLAKKNGSQRP